MIHHSSTKNSRPSRLQPIMHYRPAHSNGQQWKNVFGPCETKKSCPCVILQSPSYSLRPSRLFHRQRQSLTSLKASFFFPQNNYSLTPQLHAGRRTTSCPRIASCPLTVHFRGYVPGLRGMNTQVAEAPAFRATSCMPPFTSTAGLPANTIIVKICKGGVGRAVKRKIHG